MNTISTLNKHKEKIFFGIFLLISIKQLFGLFSHGISIHQDHYHFSNYLNYILKIFQNVIFFFLFSQFFIKYNIKYILIAIPLAIWEQKHNFFVHYVHPLLLDIKFYNLFSSNPSNISPEYPRIIVFSIFLFTFLVLIFYKKFRTLPRIFLLLSSSAIFLTSILFHHIIVSSINIYKEQQQNILLNVAKTLKTEEEIIFFCKNIGIKCLYTFSDQESQYKLLESDKIPKYIKNYIQPIKKEILNEPLIFDYITLTDFSQENRILAQHPVSFIKNNNFFVITIDDSQYRKILIDYQYLFVKLGFASHIVWFFGALFLISFHTARLKNRPRI